MSDRPSFLLDLRLADLSGWWLQLQCCRGMTCLPCRLLATQRPAGSTLDGTLRSLRCRQCRRRQGRVVLMTNPADRAEGRAGSPSGWRIEVTLPDPGWAGRPFRAKMHGSVLVCIPQRCGMHTYVKGSKGKSYSKTSITAEDRDGNIIRGREQPAARLRGDIAKIYAQLPAGCSVFATKRVEEILIDSGALPPDTPTMHFGDLRGKNSRQHDPGALLVSAENVGIGDVEAKARAFLADDPVPFVSMDHVPLPTDKWKRWEHQWHYWATRMRRMRDGTLSPVEVPVHPDPRMQAVLEITREDELIQAVDRLRSIWNRRQFTLLNNLCLDLTYDEIDTHKHLVLGGNPIMRALLATGILPHTPELLHRAHPTIFRSPKAAEMALARYPQNPGGSLLWDLRVSPFRRVGQTGRDAKATVDRTRWPDDAALIAAIEAFTGPLQSFQGAPVPRGAAGAAMPATPMGAGWVPPAPRRPGRGAAPPSVWVHGPPDG